MSLKQIWQAANPKGHLLTAISFLIPIVCGSGFIIAIGMGLGGTVQDTLTPGQFDVWQAMATLGAKALGLLPVVIAVGISGSIAGKPGIAPGFVVGLAANTISAGFIGGMIGGYIAGYIALAIIKNVKVPDWARGLMPTLIVPFFASIISCLIMVYIIGTPIGIFTEALTSFLRSMGTSSNLVLGAVIGALCIVDFGGPLNKTCFAFVLTLQAQGINEPITALQLVNTATPIGFGLAFFIAKLLRKNIYNREEVETLKSAVPMGIVNIVEGSIPIVSERYRPRYRRRGHRWRVRWRSHHGVWCGCHGAFWWGTDDPHHVTPDGWHYGPAGEYCCYRHGLCCHQKRYSA